MANPADPTLTTRMDEETYQRIKAEADLLGLSVQQHLQNQLDALARASFPEAFRKG